MSSVALSSEVRSSTRKKKRIRGGATFVCIACDGKTMVRRTTRLENGVILRERICKVCGTKFETKETRAKEAKVSNGKKA
jgi:transcription elongation factor Elf1